MVVYCLCDMVVLAVRERGANCVSLLSQLLSLPPSQDRHIWWDQSGPVARAGPSQSQQTNTDFSPLRSLTSLGQLFRGSGRERGIFLWFIFITILVFEVLMNKEKARRSWLVSYLKVNLDWHTPAGHHSVRDIVRGFSLLWWWYIILNIYQFIALLKSLSDNW